MAKNVLAYVQACLNVMDSDQVDDNNDTSESLQVAEHLKEVYLELMNRQEWQHLHGAITLTAAADVNSPTQFAIPETVRYIDYLAYNTSEQGEYRRQELKYLEPECFVQRFANGEDATNKLLVTVGTKEQFYVTLDAWPMFWTSFDDQTIYMDAVHQDFDSTLVATKLSARGVIVPTFSVTNSHTPNIPLHMEPLLQAELNRECFKYFKQVESTSDEKKAKRQLARARRESSKIERESDRFYVNRFGRNR